MLISLPHLALFQNLGWQELLILAALALLIFGKRLPEVGRSLGRGIVEFKKGLAGIEDDVDRAGKISPPAKPKGQVSQGSGSDEDNATSSESSQPTGRERNHS